MTDKTKKILMIALSALVVALAVALVIVLIQPSAQGPNVDNSAHPEHGTYYFDAGSQEYTLTLNPGNRFTLYVKGGTESGAYTLTDKELTLDFTAEGVENIVASMENEVVTLTFNGATMRFLKKVTYTVNYEVNGGQAMEAVTVLNGKTVTKPADPTRDGFVFIGWYADSEFKTPFAFGADPVTGDVTLYARWSEALLGGEYVIDFDANYADAEAIEAMPTTGGKLFELPTVTREGYEFKGWWISMTNNGEQLSYPYEAGMLLDGNTTLFAMWQANLTGNKLATPIVKLNSASLSWGAVSGARSYSVSIIDAEGYPVINNESTSATTFNVAFDTLEAGLYEIRVVAYANTGDADNSESVTYFINKALGQVNSFEVIDSMLVFNTVEHAEKYLITVVCGNAEHNHTNFDNGTSRTFNFANCEMTTDGIRFTVTAMAEGYGTTVSREFVYRRDLNAVEGLRYDEATQTVVWNEVPNAAYYMVSVKCGNAAHNHEFVSNSSQTFVSLKGCDACEGGIVVKVYPKTNGFNSPAASEIVANKVGLATPSDIRINGTVLSWASVNGATKYEVMVGQKTYEVTETSYDLAKLMNWVDGTEYAISVRAVGATESLWSDVQNVRYAEMNERLNYHQNTLSWLPVIGATAYEIQINDGEIITVTDGATSIKVTLTQAGTNVLKVRYLNGSTRSQWISMEVYAHAVIFDTRGGGNIPTQYLAVGDKTELPTTSKDGYEFAAWYNVPGGPSVNGKAYTDELFAESGAMVLYAHYTPSKYVINYNYGDGGSADKATDEVAYESHYQLIVPTPDSATGAFAGWYSAPYGMGIQYTDARGNSLTPWNVQEGATMYAFWVEEALQFTLTKIDGKDVYMVSAGPQIAQVSEITVPTTYNGLPVAMVAGNGFTDCTSLEIINLPESLQFISVIAPFDGCSRLKEINVYDVEGVVSPRYWSKDGVLFDNGTTTSSMAQAKLFLLPLAKTGVYEIPDGIVEIPERALAATQLTRIVIPASVVKIGLEAFADNTKLTTIVFERGAQEAALTIGARAFANCTAMERITLPARLANIDLSKYIVRDGEVTTNDCKNAFAGCTALKSIMVASGSTNFKSVDGVIYSGDGKTLLYCPNTVSGAFTVPSGTVTIAAGAFIGCDRITEVTLPNSVTLVGEYAFYGLRDSLTKVTFGGNGLNAVVINKYAFTGCTALTDIVYESGSQVSIIEEGAFKGCTSLEMVRIPTSMTKIGYEAFADCTAITMIEFAASSKNLAFGESVFKNCSSLTVVNLPANVTTIPGIFGGCTSLQEVNVAEDSQYLTSIDGVVFTYDKTEVLFFPRAKTGQYRLPETVSVIGNGVFANVTGLTKLYISNAITRIGEGAFMNASITNIVFEGSEAATELVIEASAFEGAKFGTLTLPAHTTVIGDRAFANANYANVKMSEGVVSLGNYAFYGVSVTRALTVPASVKTIGEYCFASRTVGYSDKYATKVTLTVENSQLETIGKHAFDGNEKQVSIEIPATVTSIGDYAFYSCTKLATITFGENSVLETIGGHAFHSCSAVTSLTIPKTVTTIYAKAFYGCSKMTTITFEEGGTEDLVIGKVYEYTSLNATGMSVRNAEVGEVFNNCNALATASLPSRLVEIAPRTFYYAGYSVPKLTVTFGEDSRLANIGEYAFYGANLEEIVIPKTVRNLDPYVNDAVGLRYDRMGIGAYAFANNYDTLVSVTFELGGTEPLTIGEYAFDNARLLTSIELPARLAPYTSYTGEEKTPFANGAKVFDRAELLESITIEDGGANYVDVNGVVFTTDMKELIICPAGMTGSIEIPATVTRIYDYAFYNCSKLDAVTFAGGTEPMTIGKEAFRGCSMLTEITLPDNVTTLGSDVFYKCSGMQTLNLGKNVSNFDGGMILDCASLKNIYVTEGTEYLFSDNGVLYNADKTMLISYPMSHEGTSYTLFDTVQVVGAYAFCENTYIQEVVLPNGLQQIKQYAFEYCTNLKKVQIPNTVTVIDLNAFYECSALTQLSFEMGGTGNMVIGKNAFAYIATQDLVLPATVTTIAHYGFYRSSLKNLSFEEGARLYAMGDQVFQATSLVNVVFPAGLTSIGNTIFYGCNSLKYVEFGEGLVTLGNETFSGTSVETVKLPASLKDLGVDAFSECANLKEVTFAPFSQLTKIPVGTFASSGLESFVIPATVQEIVGPEGGSSDKGAFYSCQSLVSVTFAEGSKCKIIGANAFEYCTALLTFDVPASVTTLGEEAFANCEALESIIIPANTTNFGGSLFSSCYSLSEVVMNSKATELPGWMFANCHSLTEITIPAAVSSIGGYCFINSGLQSISVDPANPFLTARDGVLFDANMTKVIIYPDKRDETVFVVPATVTAIEKGQINGAQYLKELIFEEGETPLVIGADALSGMKSLVKVELPDRLVSIGEYAFEECKSLMMINIPANMTESSFGNNAFYGCEKLFEIYNESALEITAGTGDFGGLTANALNVYTPTSGQSQFNTDENGFITLAQVDGDKTTVYLVGYTGSATEIIIPSNVDVIYKMAFANANITKVEIPEGIVEIGDSAFEDCEYLTEVVIPSTVNKIGKKAFRYCESLKYAVIPASVTDAGYYAFRDTGTAQLLVGHAEEPSVWNEYWTDNKNVFWGYDGAEHTYTFETNGGDTIAPIVSDRVVELPVTTKEGFVFVGWFDNAALTGKKVSSSYYNSGNVTLYAKWVTEEEFNAIVGTSFEDAIEISIGDTITVTFTEPDQKIYLAVHVSQPSYGELFSNVTTERMDAENYDTSLGYLYKNQNKSSIDQDGDFIYLYANCDNYIVLFMQNGETGTFEVTLAQY